MESLPPKPSDARPDRSLAVLRTDWDPGGDYLAIDHRPIGDETLVEIGSKGRIWLGPSWTSDAVLGKLTPTVPTASSTGPFADFAEWTYKVGTRRVTRCVGLFRGRSLALLGQQDDGPGPAAEFRIQLGEGIVAHPIEGSRALRLISGRGQATAYLLPLGLPAHDRLTDLGSITIEGGQVVIRQTGEGLRRRWLPVAIGWGKIPTIWRPLTVAFRSKISRKDVASAVRIAWGPRDEGLVIYRSLAPPALRSFLGHQTSARILVGGFSRSGEVRPILKVGS